MHVRPETPADRAAVRAVVAAAFDRDLEAELVDALRSDPAFRPDLTLVAVDEGVVVGHVMLTEMVHGGRRRSDLLALAPISVAPERQGMGVGRRLMEEALSRAEAAGAVMVVLVGEPAYYARFGFSPARDLGITAPPYPEEFLQARTLGRGGVPIAGAVEYAAAFAAFED